MKTKIYFLLIMLLVIIFIVPISVKAANPIITLNPSAAKVKKGETFTVGVEVECTTSFQGITGILEYDKTKLEITNVSDGTDMKDLNSEDSEGNYNVSVVLNSNKVIKQTVCETITFKVLDGAKTGDILNIKLKDIDIKDGDDKSTDLVATTFITIEDTSKPNENQNNNPTNNDEPSNKPSENGDKTSDLNKEKTDDTKANKEVNYTGAKDNAIIIGITAIIGIVSFIKYRQYKNI